MVPCKSHFVDVNKILLTHAALADAECQCYDGEERPDVSSGDFRAFFRRHDCIRRIALVAETTYFARSFGSGLRLPVVESRLENRSLDRTDMNGISSLPGMKLEYGIETGNWYGFPPQDRTRARTKAANVYGEMIDPVKAEPFGPGSLFLPCASKRRAVKKRLMEITMKKINILMMILSFVLVAFVSGQALAQSDVGKMTAPGAQSPADRPGGTMDREMQKDVSSMPHVSKAEMPMRVSKLIGRDVVNKNDEKLGEVHDFILDKDGKISYMIISHGGLLGIGDKLTPVPWNKVASAGEVQMDTRDNLVLNIAKATLDQAPTFSSTDYMNFAQRDFQNKIDQHFAGTTGP
ncbi:hypothetical protein Desti_0046 [Desulfomonile tiedjei DSM 6799]|uniref:PRC-barrel domain-containing protein n=1 Tax=Desulfomonile tiedjei (strain ATCC 49306 / DSM 6799 / DCB-1) TaxID=706587 RepID=I4BZQ5_DESTA|nr:hypothetical protein Desti_0046 [Desulfomonile tiedjei DSM 6799]